MIAWEDIKQYLPKYLSPDSEGKLFQELKQFPENIDQRLYTERLRNINTIYQGDGIEGFLCVDLD